MASIARRHSYRFGYLKSEHWSNLRLSKLAEQDACCQICKHRDLSNDVHHVIYRKSLYETTLDELVVLCRLCHTDVHIVLRNYQLAVRQRESAVKHWNKTLKKLAKARLAKDADEYVKWFRVRPPNRKEAQNGHQTARLNPTKLYRFSLSKPIRRRKTPDQIMENAVRAGCPHTNKRKINNWFKEQRRAKKQNAAGELTPGGV